MKTKYPKQALAVLMSCLLVIYNLFGILPTLSAAPPEGRGSDRAQEVSNQGNKGGNGRDKAAQAGSARAELARKSAERANSKQAGGKDFHAKGPGDYGQRELPAQANDNAFSHISNSKIRQDAQVLKSENRRIIEDFEKAIGKLREHGKGKENARWWYNPKDDRGQGNMGKVDMLDPYGHSKDDRMELYGNRGRVIREIEELLSFLYAHYLFIDGWTFYYWTQIMGIAAQMGNVQYYGLYDWSIFSNIYSTEEIAYLQSLSYEQMMVGYQQGYLAMPATDLTLSSISELDLSRIVNYADISGTGTALSYYVWGQPVQYDVSLTNIYDQPLTLTVSTSVYDFVGTTTWSNMTSSKLNGGTFYYPTLLDYQLKSAKGSDSVETWENITLQPGEILTLSDTYDDYSGYYGVSHYFVVTVTDTVTGQTYTDPYSGWFY